MNMRCTARLKFDAIQVAKIAIYTAFICNFRFRFTHTFLSQKIFMHFLVTKRICAHFFFREHGLRFFRENDLRTLFVAKKWFTHLFCRENNLLTLSRKFLRVEFCHLESSDFLGLCHYGAVNNHFLVYKAIFGMVKTKRTNNRVILEQACSWPVRRQSFASQSAKRCKK